MSTNGLCADTAAQPLMRVQPGRFRDILFFVRHIVLGARARHFSEAFLHPAEQLLMVKTCCAAILRNLALLPRRISGRRFLVARLAGRTVGAALIETAPERHKPGEYLVVLSYLVVAPEARRQGAASALVQRMISDAPAPGRILCACAPASRGMMKLLSGLRFQPGNRAAELPGMIAPRLFQYRKTAAPPPAPQA